jgi:predicted RNA-binding protein YlqC (UPF0109 family)
MMNHIRNASGGANIRGTDLDDDARLVLISGPVHQVLCAFDLAIQSAFTGPASAMHSTFFPAAISGSSSVASASGGGGGGSASVEVISVCLLVEHAKAGRVVGPKGATLQAIKSQSGAVVRVEKEAQVRVMVLLCVCAVFC